MPDHGHYAKPLAPETAAALSELEAKAKAPKKERKRAKRRPKLSQNGNFRPLQLDDHVRRARPYLIGYRATLSMGHRVPLSFHYRASPGAFIWDHCGCEHCQAKRASRPHSTT